ncbi:MAG: YihY/virulence factor BrkB family protein [Holophagaceae bacterium]|nr:YihY/virulence factor BrkB family protein [Holophagaceae bacterium]
MDALVRWVSKRAEALWKLLARRFPRLGRVGQFAWEVGKKYNVDDCFSYAASLSFWLIVSLVPLTTLLFKLLGLMLGSKAYGKALLMVLLNVFPYLPMEFVRDTIQNSQKIGTMGFSWAVLMVGGLWCVNQLDTSLAHVFGIRVRKHRQTRRFHLVRRAALVVSAVILLAIFVALLTGSFLGNLMGLPRSVLLPILTPLLGMLVVTMILQHLPRCHVRFRHALLGAFVSTSLWWIAKTFFRIYLSHTLTFGIMYGSLSSIIAALIFLYYSCAIFLLGAEITAAFYRHETGAFQIPAELRKS